MRRLPIRVRLTAGFAVLVTVVLGLAGLFIYQHVRSDLDQTIDGSLRSRADVVTALIAQADSGLAQGSGRLANGQESFAQVLRRNGTVLDSTPGAKAPALDANQVLAAALSMDEQERATHAAALRKQAASRSPQDWLDDQLRVADEAR